MMKSSIKSRLGMMAACLALAGCALPPIDQPPAAGMPSLPARQGQDLSLDWQEFVTDAHLRRMVAQALTNNHDLRQTLLNLQAVRAQYRIQRAERLPGLDVQAGGTRQHVPGDLAGGQPQVQSSWQAGVGVTAFELDLFGRVRSLSEAALQEYLATEEGARSVRISLVADVIQSYAACDGAQRRHALALKTLQAREASLALTAQRRQAGVASSLDVQEAEGLVEQARADVAAMERAERQSRHALALLTGGAGGPGDRASPNSLNGTDGTGGMKGTNGTNGMNGMNGMNGTNGTNGMTGMTGTTGTTGTTGMTGVIGVAGNADILHGQRHAGAALVRDIAPGVPSDLLQRRPDIRAAEHRLKARHADIGAARAAFFPRISLTGFFGSSSAELSGLFDGGQRAWTFMPQVTLPVFDAGRLRANLDLATIRRDMAVAAYEQAIQSAFRETADALAAADTLRREEIARQAQAASSRKTLALAEARYRAGVDDHLRYLDAQRNAYASDMAAIDAATQRQAALAALFKALGGSWPGGAGGKPPQQ